MSGCFILKARLTSKLKLGLLAKLCALETHSQHNRCHCLYKCRYSRRIEWERMLRKKHERAKCPRVILTAVVAVAIFASFLLCAYPLAFAAFNPGSSEQIIGVGRIQSSTPAATIEQDAPTARFEVPEILAVGMAQEKVAQLAQPLERDMKDAEQAAAKIADVKRFGRPDEEGWFHCKATAYGPGSTEDVWTATGTELTLTSTDVAIDLKYLDLMGRYIYIEYKGVVVKSKIVDCGNISAGSADRLLDLQPGLCTAFGAETPEFGWGVRSVRWKFAD